MPQRYAGCIIILLAGHVIDAFPGADADVALDVAPREWERGPVVIKPHVCESEAKAKCAAEEQDQRHCQGLDTPTPAGNSPLMLIAAMHHRGRIEHPG